MNFINMEIWKNLIEINIQVFVKCYFYSLLLLFPYYSSKMLFLKYLYNHGDWFEKGKFGILKLFGIFYHLSFLLF